MEEKVFRFKFKNRFFKLEQTKKGVSVSLSANIGDPEENYSLIKPYIVNTYSDVTHILRQCCSELKLSKYYNIIENDYLIIFRSVDLKKTIKPLLVYKFENEEIKKTFEILLNHKDSLLTISSVDNYFNWLVDSRFLDVLLTKDCLTHNNIPLYEEHQKLKKNGKVRTYYAPNELLKSSLRSLNNFLQIVFDKKNEDFQVAYKKGKSVYDNAAIHKNKTYVYNIDLKDFYPSCKRELVRKYIEPFFKSAPNVDEIVNRFLDIILINDGLFIGSPVSGCLANAILSNPVLYMKNICAKHDMEFSVYADDMTFSSDRRISKEFVNGIFEEAFNKYKLLDYFKLNEEKSVGFTGRNRKVTGVSINQYDELTTKRQYYRLLRTMIHHLSKGDQSVNIQKLQGKIAYALMIDDSGKTYRYLLKYKDTVSKYNLCSPEKMEELKVKFGGK